MVNKSIISDHTGNDIRISNVMNYENSVYFHGFSAKYVCSGNEFYLLNNKKLSVSSGEYVLGNQNTSASVIIDSTLPVKGICIDISKEKINEIIDFGFKNNKQFKKFIFEQEWIVNKYITSNTHLGYALHQLATNFENIHAGNTDFSEEIFYSIAECIVKDQEQAFKQFQNLKAVKEETNGRVFNFIHDAKNYMDTHFLENINLEDISLESKLSVYHFIRLFNTVFQITPYQYLLQKRLDFAKGRLLEGADITDITYQTGFSNPANFSKAFKNQFGKSPRNFLK